MSTAGQKFMTELSTRSINAAAADSSETCPLCGGNDLIRGVRYAKYSDTKDDAVRCQACDCNFPLKAWNARHVAQEVDELRLANTFNEAQLKRANDEIARLRGLAQQPVGCGAETREAHAAFDRMLRANVIEACAKIAEPWAGFWLDKSSTDADRAVVAVRTEIAAKIRSLAIPSTHQSAPDFFPSHSSERLPSSDAVGSGADTEIATAKAFLREKPSTSYLQRKMQITYNHACSLMTALEREGFISLADSQGRRTVLLPSTDRGTP